MNSSFLTFEGVSKVFTESSQNKVALSNVSFDLEAGSATSIIGRNGAGKSTLLRIAAGILAPSAGQVSRQVRTASLIELGMAFHPDLTGRDNLELGLYLAGAGRREIRKKFDQVVEFGNLSKALDQQVKHYSNGMIARLASAIAVHSKPDLLLVDEIMAVGDVEFQTKMLDRIYKLVEEGTTLALVTHSPSLAAFVSRQALWIDEGEVQEIGPTTKVLARYEADYFGTTGHVRNSPARFGPLKVEPIQIQPMEKVWVSAVLSVERNIDEVVIQVEFRPVVGDEAWMRKNRHRALRSN